MFASHEVMVNAGFMAARARLANLTHGGWLAADLPLTPAGARQTLMRVDGAYRPPLGGAGAGIDRALLHQAATATIRALLSPRRGCRRAPGPLHSLRNSPLASRSPGWPPGRSPRLSPAGLRTHHRLAPTRLRCSARPNRVPGVTWV